MIGSTSEDMETASYASQTLTSKDLETADPFRCYASLDQQRRFRCFSDALDAMLLWTSKLFSGDG